jgi:alanyl-tRNA synthetase
MLGNFSFGDYFKEGAIEFAWNLLVGEWKIDPGKMLFTVFEGADGIPADDEARALWRRIAGVGDDRILGLGMKENFWAMGETGPCGPCSEIHIHLGDDLPCARAAAGQACLGPACDCDRWNEIWNLVFMQYERRGDGQLVALPAPSIDTGMGLERTAAILQGKRSNYDIDLFARLLGAIGDLAGTRYGADAAADVSLRVIADHIRASAFLVGDGVYPSNEGRGYVLRRIMRRMIRHGRLLGLREPAIFGLAGILGEEMGRAHPILIERAAIIADAIRREEELFLATLDRGIGLLDESLSKSHDRLIPGEVAFRLYDTYGFPPDLTALIAAERGFTVDEAGFAVEMDRQRERSRGASHFAAAGALESAVETPTEFLGYDRIALEARVLAVEPGEADAPWIVLDRTPCYAESGGQIGDRAAFDAGGTTLAIADTRKNGRGVFFHRLAPGATAPAIGATVTIEVDRERRLATERHHTATHLLHAALRAVIGPHVQQSGSYVGPDRLRFDFSHHQAMTPDEIRAVEDRANRVVIEDLEVTKRVLPIEEARALGATAFFDEKYGEFVRVVSIEGTAGYQSEPIVATREFCGGTHVRRSGEIGLIRIVSESAIASGVRRIEAVAGGEAFRVAAEREALLGKLGGRLSAPAEELEARIVALLEERKRLGRELETARLAAAMGEAEAALGAPISVGGIALVPFFIENLDPAALRQLSDRMIKKLGAGIVVVGSNPANEKGERKAALCVQVSRDLTPRIKAGAIVGALARLCGGGGGGRPEMAEAGGKDAAKVAEAIRQAPAIITELLG